MNQMDFNYETETVTNETVYNLLQFIGTLHGILASAGLLPDGAGIDTETHQQLMILAKEADARKKFAAAYNRGQG